MVDFTGTWKNQLQSTLELRVLGDAISGRFDSGVGDDGNQIWVNVAGQVQGDLITFHAAYPQFESLVTWIGQHTEENGVGKISMHWIHVTNIADPLEQKWMWFSNRIGADVFTRV